MAGRHEIGQAIELDPRTDVGLARGAFVLVDDMPRHCVSGGGNPGGALAGVEFAGIEYAGLGVFDDPATM